MDLVVDDAPRNFVRWETGVHRAYVRSYPYCLDVH